MNRFLPIALVFLLILIACRKDKALIPAELPEENTSSATNLNLLDRGLLVGGWTEVGQTGYLIRENGTFIWEDLFTGRRVSGTWTWSSPTVINLGSNTEVILLTQDHMKLRSGALDSTKIWVSLFKRTF